MKIQTVSIIALACAAAAVVVGCASAPAGGNTDQLALQVIRSSFTDKGIAKLDRLSQDFAQAACSSDQPPDAASAQRIMAEAKASVKWPAGGHYLGDWRKGEKLAQKGRGMTWRDNSTAPSANGGSCYNCHQLAPQEISFGTIGPSLYRYGPNHGVTNLDSPSAQSAVEYTWMKLYNARSYSACSQMPRFGHAGLLDEEQMRDLMALLLDPQSPVNR